MSAKSDRKRVVKAAAQRFGLGRHRSAAAAHRARQCLVGCTYCRLDRTVPTSGVRIVLPPGTARAWGM